MAAILMVEPPSAARDDLERALRDAGHKVLVVGDGEEALQTWRTERQELAILDESAPRLNGLGVALRMKAETPAGFMPASTWKPVRFASYQRRVAMCSGFMPAPGSP